MRTDRTLPMPIADGASTGQPLTWLRWLLALTHATDRSTAKMRLPVEARSVSRLSMPALTSPLRRLEPCIAMRALFFR
jgi:hypothetical protein